MTDVVGAIADEQAYVDRAYERLAVRRAVASGSRNERTAPTSLRARFQRDELDLARARREDALDLGDLALCFGRLDIAAGAPWYIGRLAVDDEARDPLVIDWRAPVAEPFYRATPTDPLGVVRRRHLRCRGATVLGLDDEVLDRAGADGMEVVGEAALLRALERRRTGRMGDIVATIQRAQDEAIRAPLAGALVVQGGPGTGKTAVALHRIAYLAYTHREVLAAKGVLLVGPNATFLRYIERVLPSLGEQGTTFRTASTLVEGLSPTRTDEPAAAAVKGDMRMVEVLERAISDRQRPLRRPVDIGFGSYSLRIGPRATRTIVERTRQRRGSHNERRPFVERLVLRHLHAVYVSRVERARQTGRAVGAPMSRLAFEEQAGRDSHVRALVERIWPRLTPAVLLRDLLTHEALLRSAADGILTEAEQSAILRPTKPNSNDDPSEDALNDGWSGADIALLDELGRPLGVLPADRRTAEPVEDRDWMADRVLEAVADDPDVSLSPTMAAEIRDRIIRDEVQPSGGSPALRRVDASFAHVVVDEAQDLSPMQWRMIARRCPSGSMTLVGDLGQASGAWRRDWPEVLADAAPHAEHRIVELTVNYRTPSEVMDLASRVLHDAAPELRPPTSIRTSGDAPVVTGVPIDELPDAVAEAARSALEAVSGGTVAVIAPTSIGGLRAALEKEASTRSTSSDPLDDAVALLAPNGAKGLEFDAIVVVEPDAIVRSVDGGLLGLYVALTRTTGRLAIVHSEPLPASLRSG